MCLTLLANTLYAQQASKRLKLDSIQLFLSKGEHSAASYQVVKDSFLSKSIIDETLKMQFVDTLLLLAKDSVTAVNVAGYCNYLGQYFRYKGNYTNALSYYKKSHRLYLTHGIKSKREYLNIGHLYGSIGDQKTATKYYQKALIFAQDTIPDDYEYKNHHIGWATLTLGKKAINRNPDSALICIRKAINIWKGAGEFRENSAISYAYKAIADYYILSKKDYKSALLIADTIKFWDKRDSLSGINFAMIKGVCSYRLGQIDTALFWLHKLDNISSQPLANGFERYDALAVSKDLLAEVYRSQGVFDKAYHYEKQASRFRSVINSKKNQGVIAYERERKHLTELRRQKDVELHNEKTQKLYLTLGASIFVLLALVLIFQLKVSRKANRGLVIARQTAERSEAFKRQFLANMSHEIRTPMNATLGLTRLLLSTELNPEQKKYLNAIHASSENLLTIINDILDLSKMEAGKMKLVLAPIDFHAQMDLLLQTFQLQAEEKEIEFTMVVDEGSPKFIISDSVRLNQVLVNLCGNAIKFTEKGFVKVTVSKKEDHEALEFSIEDSGVGISDTEHALLFNEFAQVGKASDKFYSGTGLGLSISKSLVELVGGSINFKSQEEVGSIFNVTWPYSVSSKQEFDQNQEQDLLSASPLKGIRILLAEDNPFNMMVINDTLNYLIPDCVISPCENGEEVLAKLENTDEFDIVLMDVNMPVMSGPETTKHIRKNSNKTISQLPILAFTSSILNEDISEINDAGMDDYIPKPFSHQELISKLLAYYKK